MTVYVDEIADYGYKGKWCHMIADDLVELHSMADKLGLKRQWFQDVGDHPHYDLRPSKRILAVTNGAVEISAKELVKLFRGGKIKYSNE